MHRADHDDDPLLASLFTAAGTGPLGRLPRRPGRPKQRRWRYGPFRAAFLVALLLVPAYYHVRRNMIKYTVTDSKLQIDTGLVARTTKNIPLSKVQDVTVSATIPQRLMGFGDIIIDNASELGGSIVMHNISNPRHYADLLLRELRRWH